MPQATITSKGQVTIPRSVRDLLQLRQGDRVDFVEEGNRIILRRVSRDVEDLRGILKKPGRKPVSIRKMNRVIRSRKPK